MIVVLTFTVVLTGSRTLTLIFAMLDLYADENQAKYKLTYRNKRTDRVTHTQALLSYFAILN